MASTINALTYYDMVRSYLLAYPIKAMLVTANFTYDPEVHEFRSSIFNEASGAGYTAGGVSVNANVVLNKTANCVELVAPAINFGIVTVDNVSLMLVYRSTGVAASDRIIAGFTFPAASRSAASFSFEWDTFSTVPEASGNGIVGRFNY